MISSGKYNFKKNIKSKDFIICLAASGNTPFTNEIIKLALKNNVKCLE